LFMKAADGSFMVKMACGNDRAAWRRKSQASGFVVTMARDFREWGVF